MISPSGWLQDPDVRIYDIFSVALLSHSVSRIATCVATPDLTIQSKWVKQALIIAHCHKNIWWALKIDKSAITLFWEVMLLSETCDYWHPDFLVEPGTLWYLHHNSGYKIIPVHQPFLSSPLVVLLDVAQKEWLKIPTFLLSFHKSCLLLLCLVPQQHLLLKTQT